MAGFAGSGWLWGWFRRGIGDWHWPWYGFFDRGFGRCLLGVVRLLRRLGGSCGGGEVLAVLAEVEERVAVLAIEGDLVAADEFDAVDIERALRGFVDGGLVEAGASAGDVGEALPRVEEVE